MRIEVKNGIPEISSEYLMPRIAKLASKMLNMRGHIASMQLCHTIVTQLVTDWRNPRVTKRPSYSFLRHGDKHPSVVKELLAPGVRIFTESEREEWQRDPQNSPAYAKEYTAVPPHIPVIYFTQIAVGTCTGCEKSRPLIRERVLFDEGTSYEEIKRTDMVVCITCGEIGPKGSVIEHIDL